jgi:hypothetical protein
MKKSLFSLLLICFAFIGVAKAQRTLTVYDGTATSNYVPMYVYYFDDFTRSQYVIPAAEIEAMTTGEISAITFYTSLTSDYTTVSNVDIYVTEVESASISDFVDKTDDMIVYQGTVDFVVVDGKCQTTITFNEPYTYNGGNLLIGCDNTTDAGYKSIYFYGQTVSGASVSGSNGSSLSGVTASQRNFIPKTTFTYTGGITITCFKPENLTATLTPGNGSVATLAWELVDEDPADAWVLQYGIDETFAEGSYTEVTVNTNPTTELTNLTAETTYYARVKPECDTEGTKWSNVASFTPSDKFSITLNNGTTTNSLVPVYGLWVDSKSNSQFIIPASVLTNIQWGSINKITFYSSNANVSWGNASFVVYMTETTETTLTGLADWGTMQSVYEGSLAISNNIMEIELSTPYQYLGGNLLIGINQPTAGSYSGCSWYGVAATSGASVGGYGGSASAQSFLPKVTIDYTPGEQPSCFVPTSVTADPFWTSANLSWEGSSESYVVQYRTPETSEIFFYDGFEDGLDNWTLYTQGEYNGWTAFDASSNWSNHSGDYSAGAFSWASTAYNADNYLVTPKVSLQGTLKFWVYSNYADEYEVLLSTGGNAINDFRVTLREMDAAPSSWTEISIDLSEYGGREGYIAIHHVFYDGNVILVDDFGIYGGTIPAGAWIERTSTETSIELTGLTSNTTYEYQVKGICDDSESDWTTIRTFTTRNDKEKLFVTAGDWNVDANWMPEGAPTAEHNITINAAATIPAGCVAMAHSVTIGNGGSILIQDGGELEYEKGEDVSVTVEKEINGYVSTKDNYYLIASPMGYSYSTEVENLLSGEYDYYWFNGAATDGLQWRNYETTQFNMQTGKGYLYANANQEGVTLRFTGELLEPAIYYGNGGSSSSYLTYDESAEFGTFNLVGNVYARKGYLLYGGSSIEDITDFYVLNEGATELEPNTNPYLLPCQGAFIQATEASQFVYVSVEPWGAKRASSSINMTIVSGNKTVDKARIRFGEGRGLEKFQLNQNSSKLYMPQDNKDYAVVYSDAQGEMPVNFKAEENGNYTISFNTENVEFGYLHLIDNMTGNDVDLLSTPSYSFDAKVTDYASRFKLVFAAGNANDDNFAFYNNGNIVINNEGNAILNIVDVLGRTISSQNINGSENVTINAKAGVYMIQLIQGNNVKTQKIVVE